MWEGKERERCLTSLQMIPPFQPRYQTCDWKAFWGFHIQPPCDWDLDQGLSKETQIIHKTMRDELLYLGHSFRVACFSTLDNWYRKEESGLVFSWNAVFEVSTGHGSSGILQSDKHGIGALVKHHHPHEWSHLLWPDSAPAPGNTKSSKQSPQPHELI